MAGSSFEDFAEEYLGSLPEPVSRGDHEAWVEQQVGPVTIAPLDRRAMEEFYEKQIGPLPAPQNRNGWISFVAFGALVVGAGWITGVISTGGLG